MPKHHKETPKDSPSPPNELKALLDLEAKTVPSEPIQPEPRFVPSKDFISVYANHIFFTMATIWDLRIGFGEVMKVENKELFVEDRVSVTMPLAVAKLLALGIQANIQQYEKQTGKTLDVPGVAWAQMRVNRDVPKATSDAETEEE